MNFTGETSRVVSNLSKSISNAETSGYYILSKEAVLYHKMVCYLAIVPCIFVAGVILNLLCCAMFYKIKNKSSTVILLIGLSTTDILIVCNAIVNTLFFTSKTYGIPFTEEQQVKSIPFFATFISNIPGRTGNLITMVISLERMLCVLMPLKIRQYSTKTTSIIAVILCYTLSTLFCLPFMFLYKTNTTYSNTTGQYVTKLQPTAFAQNSDLTNGMYISIETALKFIPVIGVSLLSSVTVFGVVYNARRRLTFTEGHLKSTSAKQENQVTKTLLVVTFTFVGFQIPNTILRMMSFLDNSSDAASRYKNSVYEVAQTSSYMILLLTSVVNFIIYYNTSSAYNERFRKMLGCTRRVPKPAEIDVVRGLASTCTTSK